MVFDTVDDAELFTQFVSSGSREIILLLVEELRIHQVGSTFDSRDFILLLVLVHFQKGGVHRLGLVGLKSVGDLFVST